MDCGDGKNQNVLSAGVDFTLRIAPRPLRTQSRRRLSAGVDVGSQWAISFVWGVFYFMWGFVSGRKVVLLARMNLVNCVSLSVGVVSGVGII